MPQLPYQLVRHFSSQVMYPDPSYDQQTEAQGEIPRVEWGRYVLLWLGNWAMRRIRAVVWSMSCVWLCFVAFRALLRTF